MKNTVLAGILVRYIDTTLSDPRLLKIRQIAIEVLVKIIQQNENNN